MLVTNILRVPTKTEATRERIESAALELFVTQGFDQTTVAQIAAAASVSEMTFFRYFRSKDALLIDDPYDPLIGDAIAALDRGLDPLVRAATGIRHAWRSLPEPADERTRVRVRIVRTTPSLQGTMWSSNASTERVIVAQLVADGAEPFAATVAASACLAALMTALYDWAAHEDSPLGPRIERALDVLVGAR